VPRQDAGKLRTVHRDTTPETLRRYFDGLRKLTPAERFRRASQLSDSVRQLARMGIAKRHPGIGPEEAKARLAVVMYGRAVAGRYFELPDDAR
jgi:hypothetical protein